jgi:hypothetical protein
MRTSLLHPAYFGSIAQFAAIQATKAVLFELHDNYQKQTYRNRTYIYGANGKLLLNIPIKHGGTNGKQKYNEVLIENNFPWQKEHWKSLEAAYRTSPFFEFYADELYPLFHEKQTKLLDFNMECFQYISDCLQLETELSTTQLYQKIYGADIQDQRGLINAKQEAATKFPKYTQVFDEKHGFLPNLSILDLIFNEGPNALTYLEQIKL